MLITKILLLLYRNIVVYFYYTARPKLINPIYYIRVLKNYYSLLYFKKKHQNFFRELIELRFKSNSTGGEWSDYKKLYDEIKSHKPRIILELGSGISSLVICYAIKKNRINAQLISMEENKFYFNQIREIFPRKYQNLVNFVLSNRKEKFFNNTIGSFYENIPNKNYDFIFIDGPTEREKKFSKKTFNADIIRLIEEFNLSNFRALLDQRITTYWEYKKFKYLRIRYNVFDKLSYIKFKKD